VRVGGEVEKVLRIRDGHADVVNTTMLDYAPPAEGSTPEVRARAVALAVFCVNHSLTVPYQALTLLFLPFFISSFLSFFFSSGWV
jgi:hypothetical protein